MSIKFSVLVLLLSLGVQADLIQIIAEGAFPSVVTIPPLQPAGTTAELEENPTLSTLPPTEDLLTVNLTVDTDRQGFVFIDNSYRDPTKSAASNENNVMVSYLPLSVTSSGFPLEHELYLNSENNFVIQNVKEIISTSPGGSDNTIIDYIHGTTFSDDQGVKLSDFYFLSVFLNSNLESLTEGQTATILEGVYTDHIVDGSVLPSITYIEKSDLDIVSVTRTTQVPEPSTAALLMASMLFLPAIRLFRTRFHRNNP